MSARNRDGAATRVADAARGVADSRPMNWVARAGLTARGCIYLLMGVLALLLALGGRKEVDQRGALTAVASQPFGRTLVLLLVIGFAGYALWRLSEAAFGATGEGHKVGPRLQSLVRGASYAVLTVTAVAVLSGTGTTQSAQQQGLTAKIMGYSGGRILIGLIGAALLISAIAMIANGLRGGFMRYFKAIPAPTRKSIRLLGTIGNIGRGLVFALVGVFVVSAAWSYSPEKAGGIDVVLKTMMGHAYGPPLAILAALGLFVFGVYGLAEARYRRV